MEEKTKLPSRWGLKILTFAAMAMVIFSLFYAVSAVLGPTFAFAGNFGGSPVSTSASKPSTEEPATGNMLPYGVTFDSAGYDKLVGYYRSITLDSLTSEQKQRFIRIGTGDRTGCGPCCGIQNGPGIDANGNTRCGCEHNLALIGLMKHIVKDYGDKYTDDQIFNEIVKWKKLFFPGQIADDGSVIR